MSGNDSIPSAMNAVKDKISPMLVCQNVPGTASEKSGRSGEKYLATPELNNDLVFLLNMGFRYKATGKVDGTCTLVQNGALYKRRDIKQGHGKKKQVIPLDWFQTGTDGGTGGHLIGFMPLDKGDKWHIDCHVQTQDGYDMNLVNILDLNDTMTGLCYKQVPIQSLDGHSVEVMGPRFQANPHQLKMHCVIRHGLIELRGFPDLSLFATETDEMKEYDTDPLRSIKEWFTHSPQGPYLEGVVLHFENGHMFKIHRHHLDLEWSKALPLEQIRL